MGALASLFQQGGFFQKNAGSISAIASLAESASTVGGGIMAQRQASKNARRLNKQGQQAEKRGIREAAKFKGAARARFAKAGVDPDKGIPLDVALESEEQALLQGRRDRLAFDTEADIQNQAGTVALIQGILGGTSTLLGAVRGNAKSKKPKKRTVV